MSPCLFTESSTQIKFLRSKKLHHKEAAYTKLSKVSTQQRARETPYSQCRGGLLREIAFRTPCRTRKGAIHTLVIHSLRK